MRRVMVMLVALSALGLSGCDTLRTAAQSKANQGAVLGGLLGTGTGLLIGSLSDHHRGLGMWIAGAGAVGALGGWFFGHVIEEQETPVSP